MSDCGGVAQQVKISMKWVERRLNFRIISLELGKKVVKKKCIRWDASATLKFDRQDNMKKQVQMSPRDL